MKKVFKDKLFLILCLIPICLTIGVIVIYRVNNSGTAANKEIVPSAAPFTTPEVHDGIVVVHEGNDTTTITTDVIQDGLQDMGLLITEEYYFTEAANFSSVLHLFSLPIGITESSFLATYDGKILAGVDFSQVIVNKDDDSREITIIIPEATIQTIDIDPNSFVLYDEKTGVGNPIKPEDYNSSLVELENTAKEKALARGILDQADSNAETVIQNFVVSLLSPEVYHITVIHQS